MRLARKFLFAVVAIALTVLAAGVVHSILSEAALHQEDIARDHELLGHALARLIDRLPPDQLGSEAPAILRSALPRPGRIQARLVSRGSAEGAPIDAALFERALATGTAVIAEEPEGKDAFVTVVPLVTPGMAVELREPVAPQRRFIQAIAFRFVGISLALTLGLVLAITHLGRRFIGGPMKLLVSQARRLGAGHLEETTALTQDDEIGELASELNAAAHRLREADERVRAENAKRLLAVEQLRHADRLATVGTLASGIAHELGTPLAVVQGRAALIEEATAPDDAAAKSARVITEQVHRMTRIIRQVLDFARRSTPKATRVPLADLTEKAVTLLAPMARKHGLSIEIRETSPTVVLADPGLMHQVITNLLMNAVQASVGKAERVVVRISETRASRPGDGAAKAGSYGTIAIEDHGRGIPADQIGHVFEPFFTTKDVGEGTGLGLSVAWGIVHDHDGWIDVKSVVDAGSVFRVCLPCADPDPAPEE